MKKTILILSTLVFIASGCGNKKQQQEQTTEETLYSVRDFQVKSDKISKKDIFEIDETCLIVLLHPNFENLEEEFQSDWAHYAAETNVRFRDELGVSNVATEKNYISFMLNNGVKFIVDAKKIREEKYFDALLYKKGEIPIFVNIVDNDMKVISDYLNYDKKQPKRKIKYCVIESVGYAVFFDDGTAFDCKRCDIPETTEELEYLEPNTTYKEYPDHLLYSKNKKVYFYSSSGTLDAGYIYSGWKIINFHKIKSRMQITNFEKDIEKINKAKIQNIDKTCLILITPEQTAIENDDYDPVIEWQNYAYDRKEQYEAIGIKAVYAEKKYLSFVLADGEKVVIDTKKEQNGQGMPPSVLLYRKGFIPIVININGAESDDGIEMIEEYLRESGDGMP